MPPSILIVDDQPDVRRMLATMLSRRGFSVVEAGSGEEALQRMETDAIWLVITDLVMPGLEGIATIRALREQYPWLRIIAMSGAFGGEVLNAAGHLGANGLLMKPLRPDSVFNEVYRVSAQFEPQAATA